MKEAIAKRYNNCRKLSVPEAKRSQEKERSERRKKKLVKAISKLTKAGKKKLLGIFVTPRGRRRHIYTTPTIIGIVLDISNRPKGLQLDWTLGSKRNAVIAFLPEIYNQFFKSMQLKNFKKL